MHIPHPRDCCSSGTWGRQRDAQRLGAGEVRWKGEEGRPTEDTGMCRWGCSHQQGAYVSVCIFTPLDHKYL